MKNIYIEALGCPKSVVDSEKITGFFSNSHYRITKDPENANIIIINTCAFIEPAREEAIETILELAKYKNKKGKAEKLIVTGCFVQKSEKELKQNLPEVDHFFNLDNIFQIKKIIQTPSKNLLQSRNLLTPNHYAYLKISEGCNNNCSYCTIPNIRGKLKSLPLPNLLEEANFLANQGVKELVLIAQDIGNYGIDIYRKRMLNELLDRLIELDRFRWIRLMYLNPENVNTKLINKISQNNVICNYLDLPIQHASDKILNSMNRNTSLAEIRNKIMIIRELIPDITLRTSIITGFPGETEEDFEILLDFLQEVEFTRLGVFKYYREEGTKAALLPNQVKGETKIERYNEIMELQREISRKKMLEFVDKKLNVIVDRKISSSVFEARTQYDAPDIDGIVFLENIKDKNLNEGDFKKVKIIDSLEYDLIAKEIQESNYVK